MKGKSWTITIIKKGETLTKAQHITNAKELIKYVLDLPKDQFAKYNNRILALSEFIENLESYANDDELKVYYSIYDNKFKMQLV